MSDTKALPKVPGKPNRRMADAEIEIHSNFDHENIKNVLAL
jgi:hypothetical protein